MRKVEVIVGVIGAGRIGQVHARNLAFHIAGANLSTLAERKEQFSVAWEFAQKIGKPLVTDDYNEIINNKRITAIVICSSTDTHIPIIMKAAQAGKHIFCEKPIDHNLTEVDKALEAVEKAGVKFQVGFNRRFDPDFARIKREILAGRIGSLRKIKIISRDPSPPPVEYIKVSGGIFMDMTCHDFDMARFLTGSEMDEIYVNGAVMVDSKIGQAGDIDTADIMLKFRNGVIVTIDNCRQAADKYDQRVEAFGSKGKIFNLNRRIDNVIISDSVGECASEIVDFFMERYKESYIIEMQAFINAINSDTEISVSGLDGRMSISMAMAAQKSLQEGRVVKLDEIEKGERRQK